MAKNLCKLCGLNAGAYRVCDPCYQSRFVPCTDCGAPTPGITKHGRIPQRTTCKACTSHVTADSRRVGHRCKVCKQRRQDVAEQYQVCPDCLAIMVPCPQCSTPMPKYRKRGWLREFCSARCNKLAHPATSEQARQSGRTRYANHKHTTPANKIARGTVAYKEWRTAVFVRDNYTCQECGIRAQKGLGQSPILHPHHIKPFAIHKELRYEVSNGVTLCDKCHRSKHANTFIGRTRKPASP